MNAENIKLKLKLTNPSSFLVEQSDSTVAFLLQWMTPPESATPPITNTPRLP